MVEHLRKWRKEKEAEQENVRENASQEFFREIKEQDSITPEIQKQFIDKYFTAITGEQVSTKYSDKGVLNDSYNYMMRKARGL